MTIRRPIPESAENAEAAPIVLILKKTQGSVWSEAGRTPLCPTVGWLRDNYGAGQYELRLKRGNRILCMTQANCAAPAPAPAEPAPRAFTTRSPLLSGNERAPARTALRGTALG